MVSGLAGKLAEHGILLDNVLLVPVSELDLSGEQACLNMRDLPAHVALDVAWWLNSVGLRHGTGNFFRMDFSRRKGGFGTFVQLSIDVRLSTLQAIADAALSLREAMDAGDVNAACERFGFGPVVDFTSGKHGRAFKAVAEQAMHQVLGQRFGQIDVYTDRPHTLTLATLLADAVSRGEGKMRSAYASDAERACAVLFDQPGLVDVAATLDEGVVVEAPARLSVKVAQARTVTVPRYARDELNLP